jgi:hypothetical protein
MSVHQAVTSQSVPHRRCLLKPRHRRQYSALSAVLPSAPRRKRIEPVRPKPTVDTKSREEAFRRFGGVIVCFVQVFLGSQGTR